MLEYFQQVRSSNISEDQSGKNLFCLQSLINQSLEGIQFLNDEY